MGAISIFHRTYTDSEVDIVKIEQAYVGLSVFLQHVYVIVSVDVLYCEKIQVE